MVYYVLFQLFLAAVTLFFLVVMVFVKEVLIAVGVREAARAHTPPPLDAPASLFPGTENRANAVAEVLEVPGTWRLSVAEGGGCVARAHSFTPSFRC